MQVTILLEETSSAQVPYLPLFHESAHTVAMVKHSMYVVRKAVQHLNTGQTSVVTVDQPLYAIVQPDPVEVARDVWRR